MLPYLTINSPFPSLEIALEEPNGLLAAGADLSATRLVDAYSSGIFPWYSDDDPILWWSPDPRTVFDISLFKPSKSLCRYVKQTDLTVTLNHAFEQVIEECAAPRNDHPINGGANGTWITSQIKQAYCQLHQLGKAHSVEVWQGSQLVGGIYGVSLGKLFCGESMFSRVTNGSKIALASLIGYIKPHGFPLLDSQVENPHLMSLGAINITRNDYMKTLKEVIHLKVEPDLWQTKILNIKELIKRS
jgi:leucyl/phenylalanyl-tRNA--protein transferase